MSSHKNSNHGSDSLLEVLILVFQKGEWRTFHQHSQFQLFCVTTRVPIDLHCHPKYDPK